MVFITEAESVYSAVRTGAYIKQTVLVFKWSNVILFELMVLVSVIIWGDVGGWMAAGIIWLKGGTEVLTGGWVNVFCYGMK